MVRYLGQYDKKSPPKTLYLIKLLTMRKIRMKKKIITSLFLLTGLSLSSMPQASDKNNSSSEKELVSSEKSLALDALNNMSGYLRSLDKFSIHADIYVDEVLENGQKIQQTRKIAASVTPPSMLMIQASSTSGSNEYYYNGDNFTIFTPQPAGFYATFKAPKTIGKLIRKAKDDFDIDIPLSDLFLWGTNNDNSSEIQEAILIGVERVNGVSCNHFAFRQKDIDWQICIQRGDMPLPLKLVITTKQEEAQPQYLALFKWDTAPTQKDKQYYTFIPDENDHKIDIQTNKKNK